ncbi:hypothetical protein [Priestia megaterium]|uniref:hypothetical protein n=1 Tax=Priestia megaterium TaxID=1404 RepID=UPI0030019D36
MADWTTGITIMGSFGAASTAQIISHVLTSKREKVKFDKECLQNLYSPVIFKIVEYINAEHAKESLIKFRRDTELKGEKIDEKQDKKNNLKPDNIFNYILDFIGKNLKYAHPSLILLYEEAKSLNSRLEVKEPYGDFFVRDSKKQEYRKILLEATFHIRMKICRELLLEFIRISNGLGALSKTHREDFQSTLFFTELYFLLKELSLGISPNELITYNYTIGSMIYRNSYLQDEISSILKEINFVIENSVSDHRHNEAFINGYHFINKIAYILSEMPGVAMHLSDKLVKEMPYKHIE